jgi:hypothetical protein
VLSAYSKKPLRPSDAAHQPTDDLAANFSNCAPGNHSGDRAGYLPVKRVELDGGVVEPDHSLVLSQFMIQ